jgi:hypothetical protein
MPPHRTVSGTPAPASSPGAVPALLVIAGASPGCGCTSAVVGLAAALK